MLKIDDLKKGDIVADPRDQYSGAYEDQGEINEMLTKHDLIMRSGKNDPGKNVVLIINGSQKRLINKTDFENNWVIVEEEGLPIM